MASFYFFLFFIFLKPCETHRFINSYSHRDLPFMQDLEYWRISIFWFGTVSVIRINFQLHHHTGIGETIDLRLSASALAVGHRCSAVSRLRLVAAISRLPCTPLHASLLKNRLKSLLLSIFFFFSFLNLLSFSNFLPLKFRL